MRRISLGLGLFYVASIAALSGCDVLADATSFTVCTDEEQFTVDTAQLGLTLPAATIPSVPCDTNENCASAQFSCSGGNYACDILCGSAAPKTCEVQGTFSQFVPIDLSSKIKNGLQASAIDNVKLDSVSYRVTENTMNFDTPEIKLYVGPSSAALPTDAGAVLFATIPVVPKQNEPRGELSPTPSGQAALGTFVKNYKTPFRVIGSAKLVFPGGSSLPAGKLTAAVRTCFKIGVL